MPSGRDGLYRISGDDDLIVVAAGRGSLNEIFAARPDESP